MLNNAFGDAALFSRDAINPSLDTTAAVRAADTEEKSTASPWKGIG